MRFLTMLQFVLLNLYLISPGCFVTSFNDSRTYFYDYHDYPLTRKVYTEEPVDRNFVASVNRDSKNVYCLYTRRTSLLQEEILVANDTQSIMASTFDHSKTTVFTIHGWVGGRNSSVNNLLKFGFLQVDDINVIVVDWAEVAKANYLTAMAAVPAVGRHVGKFIKWLTTLGMSYDKVHIVGHSLGAHVAGNAGRATGSKVRRITGLDPAGPLWDIYPYRLAKSDAQYVEIIHTNIKCLGYQNLCGDADFFPNGGSDMPGCYFSSCSHSMAVNYMFQSILYNNFTAHSCKNMREVYSNKCNGMPYLMGNSDLTKNRSGIFRVNTKLGEKINFKSC